MLRTALIFVIILGGCQTSQKTEDSLPTLETYNGENPWLNQAEKDVNLAIERGVEWRVRHEIVNNNAVNLSQLLKVAQELQNAGKSDEATQLSLEISQLVVLALQQSNGNENASPVYPQNN